MVTQALTHRSRQATLTTRPVGRRRLALAAPKRPVCQHKGCATCESSKGEKNRVDREYFLPTCRLKFTSNMEATMLKTITDTSPLTESAKTTSGSANPNSVVLGVLEDCWSAIQARNPDVPDCSIVIATGSHNGRLVKAGHWWANQWTDGEQRRGECLIASEYLSRPASDIFETLLHESAHALATGRVIADTSRQGKYHNAKYKALAEEVGLKVEKHSTRGWTLTSLTAEAQAEYEGEIESIREVLTHWKRPENAAAKKKPQRNLKCTCNTCGSQYIARMSQSTVTAGRVVCVECLIMSIDAGDDSAMHTRIVDAILNARESALLTPTESA